MKISISRFVFVSLFMLALQWSQAQVYTITGGEPFNHDVHQEYTYTISGDPGTLSNVQWGVAGNGTIISTTNRTATIRWDVVTNFTLLVTFNDALGDPFSISRSISIVAVTPPAPTTFTVSTNTCDDKTLTMTGTVPQGVTWYWQGTNASGTSTGGSNAASTWNATTTGTYYLRAYDAASNLWSTNSTGVAVTVNQLPANVASLQETNNTTNSFEAQWTAITGVNDYLLYVSDANNNFSPHWSGYDPREVTGTSYTVSGLTPGKDYYYRVKAKTAAGCESVGYSPLITAHTNIAAPTPTQETGATNTAFTANWNAQSGAVNYTLQVATDDQFQNFVSGYSAKVVSGTSDAVTGLVAGKNYYYRVRANGEDRSSAYSSHIVANTTINAPTVSQETAQTTTSFTANWASVTGVSSFLLDVADNPGFSPMLSGYNGLSVSGTSHSVTGLTPGTMYHYRLRSNGPDTDSGNSGTIDANTLIDTPTANTATSVGNTSFTANWSTVAGATSYHLEVAEDLGFTQKISGYAPYVIASGATSSHVVSGLTPGKNYYFRVFALGNDINSAWSNTIQTGTFIGVPSLGAISALTGTGFQVNWTAVSGAISYELDVATDVGFTAYVSGYQSRSVTGTSELVSGLTPGVQYHYRLRAVGANQTSGNSTVANTITPLAVPANITTSGTSETGFSISWTAVSGALSYDVEVSLESDLDPALGSYNPLNTTGTSAVITGLTPGNRYYFRLKTKGQDANSNWSAVQNEITVINAPVVLDGTDKTDSGFTAHWTPKSGVTNYRLDVATDNAFTNLASGYNNLLVTGSSLVVNGLSSGTIYYYRLRATGNAATSANSTTIETNTTFTPTIQVVGNPVLASVGDAVTLNAQAGFASYTWKKDGEQVATGASYTASQAGSYTVEATQTGITETGESDPVVVSGSGSLDFGDHNYVVNNTILISGISNTSQIDGLNIDQRSVSVQYMDGLGRPIQTVGVEASPTKKHIIQPVTYDQFGRQIKQYLPYTTNSAVLYQTNPVGADPASYNSSPQYQFYQTTTGIAHSSSPFAEMLPEDAPLNRTLRQGAPGDAWQLSGTHTVDMAYETNEANNVRSLQIASDRPYPWSSGYYGAGELFKMVTEDEDGNEVQEFTNKIGQVVLKRVQAGTSTWADTYYVYDEFGNLRVVLPPEASKALDDNLLATLPAGYVLVTNDLTLTDLNHTTGQSYMYAEGVTITLESDLTLDEMVDGTMSIEPYTPSLEVEQGFLDLWAFQYQYDHRNRMIAKKVPGAGWTYMVYDQLDRLVLTQDSVQRNSGQWTFTKYDVLDRPVLTGFYTNTTQTTQAAVQGLVVAHGTLNESIGSTVLNYTNVAFPLVANANDYLTATYYDDYTNLPSGFGQTFTAELGHAAGSYNSALVGQVIGSQVKTLDGTNTWLETVMYYDDRYRVIQTVTDNHLGGYDRSTSRYDFAGRVLETLTTHNDGSINTSINEDYSYDHGSRLLQVDHQVTHNGTAEPAVVLLKNEYNELGQLADKKLHSTDGGTNFEQSVDHSYNIRGWLTGINDAALTDGEGDYFGMDLFYDSPFSELNGEQGRYNGNISAARWSNAASGYSLQSAYAFQYDQMNRLTAADYHEKDGGAAWADIAQFGVSNLTYDLNGNILSLTRFHTHGTTAMDALVYDYTNSGNQLQAVQDNGDDADGFIDGNPTGTDYTYDGNGNMTADQNKDITAISYNHLNLPQTVTFTGNRSITYKYDAAGIKLTKVVDDNGSLTTTDYVGGFIYEDNVLQQLGHAEGRIRKKSTGDLIYDYYLKDHLGNTRITFTTETEQLEYRATMESDDDGTTDYKAYEEALFLNMATRDSSLVVANTSNEPGINNNETARLRGNDSGRQIGPGKLLEVMPGDVIDMETSFYHLGTYTDDGAVSSAPFLSNLLTLMNGAAAVASESQAVSDAVNLNSGDIFAGANGSNQAPRAYLNYILFDRDFGYLDASYIQVGGTSGQHGTISLSQNISEKGYIYVYVSNESNNSFDVYFDDLKIIHQKGKILQEDHYYPFGLSINALSSSAPLSTPNNFKYNGFEEQTDFDLGWYDYQARFYDPQLGRFMQVDPAADLMRRHSPYNYAFDNPIRFIDPDGMMPEDQVDTGPKHEILSTTRNKNEVGNNVSVTIEERITDVNSTIVKSTTNDDGTRSEVTRRTQTVVHSTSTVDTEGNITDTKTVTTTMTTETTKNFDAEGNVTGFEISPIDATTSESGIAGPAALDAQGVIATKGFYQWTAKGRSEANTLKWMDRLAKSISNPGGLEGSDWVKAAKGAQQESYRGRGRRLIKNLQQQKDSVVHERDSLLQVIDSLQQVIKKRGN